MPPANELKPGQRIRVPVRGFSAQAVFTLLEIGPSYDLEDHLRLVLRTKRGARKIIRLHEKFPVKLISDVKKGKAPVKKTKSNCKCYNHMGSKKILHASHEAAVDAVIKRHMKFGAHRVYECPTEPGRYHVTSRVDSST